MLNTKPGNLLREIHQAEKQRKQHLKHMRSAVDGYVGNCYRGEGGSPKSTPENHYHEWLSLVVPKLTFDNPSVIVQTKRPGAQTDVATAIQHGLNRWVKDNNLRQTLAQGPAVDMQFSWGVVVTRHMAKPGRLINGVGGAGNTGQPYVPRCERLSQHWYFEDPVALNRDQLRFQGHMFVRDLEDLKDEAKKNPKLGWNEKMLEAMSGESAGLDELNRPKDLEVRRGEIVGYEVWVPEYELDDSPGREEGFNGTIFTLAYCNDETGDQSGSILEEDYLRKPRPYYGPRWGPYTVFGMYTVPDDPFPLSPLVVVEEQIQDLNRHAASASRSAADYKRIVFVDSKDPKLIENVKSGKHDYVIPVNGLEPGSVFNLEVGGITEQQLGYLALARDRLDRNSGVHEAKRGVSSGGTATEAAIADEAAETRLGFIESQFLEGVQNLLKSIAWYLYHDNRVAFPLGADTAQALGMQGEVVMEGGEQRIVPPEPWYFGGRFESEEDFSFEDLELEIEPFSMSRINQAGYQARTMQTAQMVMQMAPLMVQFPFVRWQQLIDDIGNAMNVPNLGDLVDVEMAMQYAAAMMGGAPTADQGGRAKDPRLASGDRTRQFAPQKFSGPSPGSFPSLGQGSGNGQMKPANSGGAA